MMFGIALLRAVIGALFMGHGLQKLAGWFGGHGLEATGKAFEGMGLRPGKVHAAAAGAAETAGGALLITGQATPLAAGMLSGVMTTAVRKVHLSNGVWVTEGGFEYNAVLLAALFAITEATMETDDHSGVGWALAEFAAGMIGSEAILRFAGSQPAPAENAQDAMETASGQAPQPAGATA